MASANPSTRRTFPDLLRSLAFGLLAGLLAGVVMLACMAFLRLFFHVATPTEMIFDRAFPLVTVKFFIGALVKAGGYSQLKLQGVYGALAGQLAAAGFGGMVYGWFIDRRTTPDTPGTTHLRFDPRGWQLVGPGVLGVWLVFVGLLWPQLLTNYAGRPPVAAMVISSAGMLVSFAVCGVSLMFFHGLLAGRPRPAASITQSGITRRRFLAVSLGALATVTLGGMLRRMFKLGTFGYDGTQYGGPGVQKVTPNDQFYQVTKNFVDPG